MKTNDLHSPQLRNLLRGAISNTDARAKRTSIDHARRLMTTKDALVLATLMCASDLDEFYFGPSFPTTVNNIYKFNLRQETNVSIESEIQVARLRFNMNRALEASLSLGNINNAILSGDILTACNLCQDFCNDYGLSAAIARKAIYIHSKAKDFAATDFDAFQKDYSGPLLARFLDDNSSAMYSQFINLVLDICDGDTDCIEIMHEHHRILNKSSLNGKEFLPHTVMMRRLLYPANYNSIIDNTGLLYYSSSTVIDLLVDLSVASFCNSPTNAALEGIFSDDTFILARNNLQPGRDTLINFLELSHSDGVDQATYRASLVFSEIGPLARWRRAIDFEFCHRELGHADSESTVLEYFPAELRIKDLCKTACGKMNSFGTYDNGFSEIFLRTVAVLHRLRKGDILSSLEPNSIKILLAQTTGFSRLLKEEELIDLKRNSDKEESNVVVFLAMVMLNEKNPNEDLAFEMRMAFQHVILVSFGADILRFLSWLHDRTPNLCPVIVTLCDITFLERLYLLNATYAQVLETREKICRWAADKFDQPDFDVIADRLALDVKVRRISPNIA